MQPLWEKIGKKNEKQQQVRQRRVALREKQAKRSIETLVLAEKDYASAKGAKNPIFRSE